MAVMRNHGFVHELQAKVKASGEGLPADSGVPIGLSVAHRWIVGSAKPPIVEASSGASEMSVTGWATEVLSVLLRSHQGRPESVSWSVGMCWRADRELSEWRDGHMVGAQPMHHMRGLVCRVCR
jgi:hypothetical protein